MKRSDLWLVAVLGTTVGLLGGFFLGQSLSSSPGPAAAPASAATTRAPEKPLSTADSATPAAEASAARDWLARAAQLGQHVNSGATPGLVQSVADALHSDAPYSEARLLLLFEMMRPEDFPIVLDMLRKAKLVFDPASTGKNGPQLWNRFWQRFGQVDPDAALAAALQSGDLKYPGRELMEKWLFRGMALADPAHAAEAFLAHPEVPHRPAVVSGLFAPWIAKDPAAAVAWAQQNLDPESLSSAYYVAAWGVVTSTDISRGNTLLQNVTDPKLQQIMTTEMKSYIDSRPSIPTSQVLDFIAATRTVGSRDPDYEEKVAARCAATDPVAAANFFATSLPADTADGYAPLRAVMSSWLRGDPQAAENWAKGQTNFPSYPIIAEELAAAAHDRNDPAAELRWLRAAGK